MRGERTFNAILPDGRIAWLGLHPALASAGETRHFAHVVNRGAERRARALGRQSASIRALAGTLDADARRLAGGQLRGAGRLRRRLVADHARLDRRLSAGFSAHDAAQTRIDRRLRNFARRLARRDLWDQLVLLSALPLFAAYRQPGDPLAPSNLALTLTLAVWVLGDDLTELLSGSRRGLPHYLRGTDAWSFVAPFANLLTGWLLLRDLQHDPFITGLADRFHLAAPSLPDPANPGDQLYIYRQQVDLAPWIAAGYVIDFITLDGLPAVAGVAQAGFAASLPPGTAPRLRGLSASVAGGVLTLTAIFGATIVGPPPSDLRESPRSLVLAWVVDTREPLT